MIEEQSQRIVEELKDNKNFQKILIQSIKGVG
jgi:hypothetical protein